MQEEADPLDDRLADPAQLPSRDLSRLAAGPRQHDNDDGLPFWGCFGKSVRNDQSRAPTTRSDSLTALGLPLSSIVVADFPIQPSSDSPATPAFATSTSLLRLSERAGPLPLAVCVRTNGSVEHPVLSDPALATALSGALPGALCGARRGAGFRAEFRAGFSSCLSELLFRAEFAAGCGAHSELASQPCFCPLALLASLASLAWILRGVTRELGGCANTLMKRMSLSRC